MTEPHVKFDVPAILCKWPSLNNARRNDGTGPYMVAEGTLAACIREFMAKPGATRHLYEIHTAPQAPTNYRGLILSAAHVIELARLQDFL
jgi:hypothetical protein